MNGLTVNLHLLLATFYRPSGSRRKILIEKPCFPSDRYAVETHLRWHGLDPGVEILEIEPDEGQLGAVVSGAQTVGAADQDSPLTGDTGRLVDMAVQGNEWLTIFNESLNRNAAHVDVQGHVIDCSAVERGAVERRPIRRRVKKNHRPFEIAFCGEAGAPCKDLCELSLHVPRRPCIVGVVGHQGRGRRRCRWRTSSPADGRRARTLRH